ncbi:gypsy/ty3 retroelement polyprotein [Tanacetum coccineum]
MVQYGMMSKIEFPKFNGEDVRVWVFRCRWFFRIDSVPEKMKVELAAMHVYDRALVCFEDPMVELKNLKQTNTIQSYQDQFESLLKKVELLESYAISLFVGGLKDEISMPIRMFKLITLADAFSMARMQEATNIAMKPRYIPGHKCRGQVYSLKVIGEREKQEEDESGQLVESNEKDNNVEMCNDVFDNSDQETLKISLNALSGVNSFQTIRVRGMVGKQPLHILVDSGGTHNFMDIRNAKRLGYKIRSTTPLLVSMANGQEIVSNYECRPFNWSIQGQNYFCDAMLLPLGGCENANEEKKNNVESSHKIKINKEIPESVTTVLQEIEDVFALPTELPPQRTHDHKIPLVPNTSPINIRPHRHPSSQKDAIEVMVKS